jgi:hypothetical protein
VNRAGSVQLILWFDFNFLKRGLVGFRESFFAYVGGAPGPVTLDLMT